MQCELDIYHNKPGERYCYIVSGSSNKFLIFLPGLTDGLYAVSYLKELQINLNKIGWSLVQFIYTSSYNGYGLSSIENDVKQLKLLIDHLIFKYNSNSFILLGFSTGCQDSIYFMKTVNKKYKSMIKGIIIHGPVSDREYEMTLDEYKKNIKIAKSLMNKSKNNELILMPLNIFHHKIAITAQRYLSLNSKMSKEDMFSSDLSDNELYQQLGHLNNIPLLIIMCGNDEYVSKHIDKEKLLKRICKAISIDSNSNHNMIKSYIIKKADHYINNKQCYQEMIYLCHQFIQQINQNICTKHKL